jgi:hypothetical protein
MFRLFPRSRASGSFKARSAERQIEVDRQRAEAVLRVIEDVLQAARVEHAGLSARVDDVLARAAITLGNDTDEYLTRAPEDSRAQDILNAEIAKGQQRLAELTQNIGHYQFLRAALLTRFPDFDLSRASTDATARPTG